MRTARMQWVLSGLVVALLVCSELAGAAEQVILERKSPYNTIYVSEDSGGLRILRFERWGARQTVGRLYASLKR